MIITKNAVQLVNVAVEDPFYFAHDLDGCVIYGRVGSKQQVKIHRNVHGFEIEIEHGDPNRFACYLEPEHDSSKAEFDAALSKMQDFVGSIRYTIQDATAKLFDELSHFPWFVASGVGQSRNGDTIYVYVKTIRHPELDVLRGGFQGHPVIVEKTGIYKPALTHYRVNLRESV